MHPIKKPSSIVHVQIKEPESWVKSTPKTNIKILIWNKVVLLTNHFPIKSITVKLGLGPIHCKCWLIVKILIQLSQELWILKCKMQACQKQCSVLDSNFN